MSKADTIKVVIYRGEQKIGSGELLPNGKDFALISNMPDLELLPFEADTTLVEEKIPMAFYLNKRKVASGEFFQSGGNVVLCPDSDQQFDDVEIGSLAQLVLEPNGLNACLNISRC